MKVLITGGTGRMAKHIQSTPTTVLETPSKGNLDLSSYDSIDKYLINRSFDGLVLNAYQYLPGEVTLDNFRHVDNQFLKSTQVNLLGTLYLLLKLKQSLKFVVFMSTGLDPKIEKQHIFYRNSKAQISDLLERITYVGDSPKVIFLHPGHMHDEYTYTQSAKQVVKLIEKIDELDNLGTYAIFDKDKMEATQLANIKSYETINRLQL